MEDETNFWGITYHGCCREVRIFDGSGNLKRTISHQQILKKQRKMAAVKLQKYGFKV